MEWLKIANINYIDLLWLDLQGNEHAVLQDSLKFFPLLNLFTLKFPLLMPMKGQRQYPEIIQLLESAGFKIIAQDFKDTHRGSLAMFFYRKYSYFALFYALIVRN